MAAIRGHANSIISALPLEIGPPRTGFGGPQPTLVFSRSTDPKRGKLPLHLDVNPTDRDQDAELERLLAAGARRVDIGQTGTETWHVLADPEGNVFCLLRRRVDAVGSDPNTR
ncbi:VOC family protein [Nocardia xishanensis]